MRYVLIAAALVASPALAQSTTPTDSSGMNGATSGQPMPGGQMSPSGTPMGGYQPSGPALSGQPTPGAPVTYQQAPSPSQAYPAPAPLDHYPPCKPGQYDQCMQVNGSHMGKHAMMAKHKPMHRAMAMKKKTMTTTTTTTQ